MVGIGDVAGLGQVRKELERTNERLDEVHGELRILNTEQIIAVVAELREIKALLQTLVEMQTQRTGANPG